MESASFDIFYLVRTKAKTDYLGLSKPLSGHQIRLGPIKLTEQPILGGHFGRRSAEV